MSSSSALNSSMRLKNKGFIRLLLSLMLFTISGSKAGGGKENAWKPLKKCKMLSASFCWSFGDAEEDSWPLKTCKNKNIKYS